MRIIVLLIAVMLVAGCLGGSSSTEKTEVIEEKTIIELKEPPVITETPAPTTTTPPTTTPAPEEIIVIEETPEPKQIEGGTEKMTDNPTAVVLTNKGEFRFELYAKRAPITVTNFVELAKSGFYDGLTFHRYEPGFVIQGGDPQGTGMGGSDKQIQLEIHPELRHVEGALGMARSQDPNSASSQFYVTLAPVHNLDDDYAVFGQVTDGMDIVQSLRKGDSMQTVTIE